MRRPVSAGNSDLFRGRPFQDAGPGDRPPLRATGVSPTIEESWALRQVAEESGTVLEVGTAWGYSAILMALAGAEVWSVDPHTDHATWGELNRNLDSYRVRDRVHPLKQYSQVALPSYLEQGAQFDAAFIDGDHSYLACNFDLWHALRLVRPGGVIAAHDYTPAWAGVKQACDENLGHLEQRRLVETLLIVRLPE